MKKNILALMLAFCMLLGLLAGCGDSAGSTSEAASSKPEASE